LRLLVPWLVALGRTQPPRWVSWISPPFEPYAPALVAEGVPAERQLVIRTDRPLWALEQTLDSGACCLALAWPDAGAPRGRSRVRPRDLRRLQLVTQRHRAPAFLFRPLEAACEASPAELRVSFEPQPAGARLQLLKSRGGRREPFELRWDEWHRSGSGGDDVRQEPAHGTP
jgi:cell division inhibitor SulA/protein ImuA